MATSAPGRRVSPVTCSPHCHDPSVPWQRIVRADGSLAKGEQQRRLLEAEGVPFRGKRVDMDVAWVPGDRDV